MAERKQQKKQLRKTIVDFIKHQDAVLEAKRIIKIQEKREAQIKQLFKELKKTNINFKKNDKLYSWSYQVIKTKRISTKLMPVEIHENPEYKMDLEIWRKVFNVEEVGDDSDSD